MKEISKMDDLSPRARIAWRRAADELLIAAIFSDGMESSPHDEDSETHLDAPAPINAAEQARAAAL